MVRTLILNTDGDTTRRLRKVLREIGDGAVQVAEAVSEPAQLPGILSAARPERILLGTEPAERCRAMAAELGRTEGHEVIAVGRISDPDLLTDLAERGVTRFLGWPFPPELARSWLQPNVRTLQYGHGDTGRHCRDRNRTLVRS